MTDMGERVRRQPGGIRAHLCDLSLLSEPVLDNVSQTLQLLQRLLLFHSLQLVLRDGKTSSTIEILLRIFNSGGDTSGTHWTETDLFLGAERDSPEPSEVEAGVGLSVTCSV